METEAREVIKLTREDLCKHWQGVETSRLGMYSFKYDKPGAIYEAETVVFTDDDGKEYVYKDRYGTYNGNGK